MTEEESSRHYYNGQLDNVNFHSEYAPTIKITGTKWMDLNKVSAEEIVKRLIKEFNLTIS
jgi:glycerol-3-phosphate dehydrogenase